MAAPAWLFALLTLIITVGSWGAVVERSRPSVTSSSVKIAPHVKHSPKSTHSATKGIDHHVPSTRHSSPSSSGQRGSEKFKDKKKKSKTSKDVDSKTSHHPTPTNNHYFVATGKPAVESLNASQRSVVSAVVADINSLYPPTFATHTSSLSSSKNIVSPIITGIVAHSTGPSLFSQTTGGHRPDVVHPLSALTGPAIASSRTTMTESSNGAVGAVVPIAAAAPVAAALGAAVPVGPPPAPPIDSAPQEHQSASRAHETAASSHSSSRRSATSSSTSATATNSPMWLILPTNGKDAANERLTTQLTELFGKELHVSQNELSGVAFWRAPLDATQVSQFDASAVVTTVIPDATIAFSGQGPQRRDVPVQGTPKRKDDQSKGRDRPPITLQPRNLSPPSQIVATATESLTRQSSAPWDLNILSQPQRGAPSADYIYDAAGGEGSTIYVLDDGANPENQDYKNMPGMIKWIFVACGDQSKSNTIRMDVSSTGHGTCVLSKAAGAKFGVAKKADVVVVRIPYDDSKEAVSYFLDALSETADDIVKRQVKNAVINMSWGWPPGMVEPAINNQMGNIIADLTNYGVIIVVSSGNTGGVIDSFPASLAKTLPIITVGAVNWLGETWSKTSGGDLMTVSAPGENVFCAGLKTDVTSQMTGTSFAAPAVAGLAAYLLSVEKFQAKLRGNGQASQLPQNMKDLIQSLAYVRSFGTDPSIYNGLDWDDATSCQSNSLLPKREACSSTPSSVKWPSSVAAKAPKSGLPSLPPPLLPSPSSAAPSPPPPASTPVSTPPILDCVMCEANCVGYTGRCTAACLLPAAPGAPDQCASCIAASSFGNQTCIDCVPQCPRSKLNGGIDCTNKEIFQPCNTNLIGQFAYPGLCTMSGYARKPGPPVSECLGGLTCDTAVGNTLNCLAAPAA